jgi:hypothetical protein
MLFCRNDCEDYRLTMGPSGVPGVDQVLPIITFPATLCQPKKNSCLQVWRRFYSFCSSRAGGKHSCTSLVKNDLSSWNLPGCNFFVRKSAIWSFVGITVIFTFSFVHALGVSRNWPLAVLWRMLSLCLILPLAPLVCCLHIW